MSVTDSIGYNCDQVALLLTTCVVSNKTIGFPLYQVQQQQQQQQRPFNGL